MLTFLDLLGSKAAYDREFRSGELGTRMDLKRGRRASPNAAIVISANSSWNLIHYRAPLIRRLVSLGSRVTAAVPEDVNASELSRFGIRCEHVPISAHGISGSADLSLTYAYHKLFRQIKPAAFLAFTIKPNIYGSLAAAANDVPVINTITGLGTGFLSGPLLQGVVSMLYRFALLRSAHVFFHNSEDLDLFLAKGLVRRAQASVIAGSGVDLHHFAPVPVNSDERPIFLFIGRLLQDKGAREFLDAASIVRRTRRARFQIIGEIEEHPKAVPPELVRIAVSNGDIELLGTTRDIRPLVAAAQCVVLPSYREGLPRVLLESCAMGTPVIATDVPGCRQVVEHGVNGLLCEARSGASLARAMIEMIDKSPEERAAMGGQGRRKAEREFSYQQIVDAYVDALAKVGAL
jgi:glycosyltransferase involved in cell wall biosynthesis